MFRTRFSKFVSLFLCFALAVTLAACEQGRQSPEMATSPFDPYGQTVTSRDGQTMTTMQGDGSRMMNDGTSSYGQNVIPQATGKVAILLPLSGAQSNIGQPMLQAAQQALFDMNESSFELLPFDTKGTAAGAQQAVQEAANAGAQLILGPLLAHSVEAAGRAAAARNLTVIGFTTDWSKAGNNVLTMGILPFDQGERLATYAAANNLKRVAILTPQGAYADAVTSSFENAARANGIAITAKVAFDTSSQSINNSVAQLANMRRSGRSFDAIVIPAGGTGMTQLAATLKNQGLGSNVVRWLGAGLWEDPTFLNNPNMIGALYAAPSPSLRRSFESNYRNLYGQTPPRLASLAYDATALSIIIMRQSGNTSAPVNRTLIMNPNGFTGIDGIFRFRSNGLAERGLAIHQIVSGGRSQIVDQAPNSFLTSGARLPSR